MIRRFPAAGVEYNYRCALENPDGVIGPWSEELVTVVPENLDRTRGACDDKVRYTVDAGGGSSSRWHSHHRCRLTRSHGVSDKRTCDGSVSHAAPTLPLRFDLAVPAFIEAFATVVDASITAGTLATTTRTPPQPRPPPLPPRPTCRLSP